MALILICYLDKFIWGRYLPAKDPVKITGMSSGGLQDHRVYVVFGASGRMGIKFMKEIAKLDDRIIVGISRQSCRWEKILKDNPELVGKVQWMRCDSRLYKEVEGLFGEILKLYGRIDAVLFMSVIAGETNIINLPISTCRNSDDCFIKLPGAYTIKYKGQSKLFREGAPGTEHPFFTNFVGLANLNRAATQFKVKTRVNPTDTNPFSDLLVKDLGLVFSVKSDDSEYGRLISQVEDLIKEG